MISIIRTIRSGARTPGPAGDSCASSSGLAPSCCCPATTGNSTGFSDERQADRGEATIRFDNPASLWTVHASQPASGKNIQQGASAKLVGPIEPDDDAEQPDGLSKIGRSLHRRRRQHGAGVGTHRCSRPPAPGVGGADRRTAHIEPDLGRRRVLVPRPQRGTR